jgi:hypothetical protein
MRIFTVTQAAEHLNLTRQRVHQVAQRMKLGTKQGHMLLFTEDDIRAMENRPDWRTTHSGRRKRDDGK